LVEGYKSSIDESKIHVILSKDGFFIESKYGQNKGLNSKKNDKEISPYKDTTNSLLFMNLFNIQMGLSTFSFFIQK